MTYSQSGDDWKRLVLGPYPDRQVVPASTPLSKHGFEVAGSDPRYPFPVMKTSRAYSVNLRARTGEHDPAPRYRRQKPTLTRKSPLVQTGGMRAP